MTRKKTETEKAAVRIVFYACVILLAFMTIGAALKTHGANSQLRALEGEWREVQRMNDLLNDVARYETLRRSALKGQILSSSLLKELSRLVPDGLVFEELDYDKEAGILKIGGISHLASDGGLKSLAQFVNDLSRLSLISEASLVNTTRVPESGRLKYEIRCVIKAIV